MGKFVDFCRTELERAGLFSKEDFYKGMTGEAVLELCKTFEEQNHSEVSGFLVRSLFDTLTKWEPITPLTGEDDEWSEIDENFFQNKRCPSVFKENGKAYQVDYYIFIDKEGAAYTNRHSRRSISFPYSPSHEFVRREENYETT